jgi:hypothetical protein
MYLYRVRTLGLSPPELPAAETRSLPRPLSCLVKPSNNVTFIQGWPTVAKDKTAFLGAIFLQPQEIINGAVPVPYLIFVSFRHLRIKEGRMMRSPGNVIFRSLGAKMR